MKKTERKMNIAINKENLKEDTFLEEVVERAEIILFVSRVQDVVDSQPQKGRHLSKVN